MAFFHNLSPWVKMVVIRRDANEYEMISLGIACGQCRGLVRVDVCQCNTMVRYYFIMFACNICMNSDKNEIECERGGGGGGGAGFYCVYTHVSETMSMEITRRPAAAKDAADILILLLLLFLFVRGVGESRVRVNKMMQKMQQRL